jgi:hypothetical protein
LREVKTFKIEENKILYCSKADVLFLNDLEVAKNVWAFYFFENKIIYYQHPKSILATLDNVVIDTFEGSLFLETYNGIDLVVSQKDEEYRKLSIASILTNKIQIIYQLPNRYIIGHCVRKENTLFYQQDYTNLKSLSLLTGEYEWEVDLGGRQYLNAANEPMEAEIQQIIGVWENQLLVSLSNQMLVGIDTNKGTILWEKCPWSVYPSLSGGLANPILEKDSVFWYSYGAYFEFHLPSLRGKLLKEYPHTDKSMPPFAIKQAVFTEKYIYFIASQKSVILNNIVGVFNRETLQIDWQEELDILPKKSSDPYNSLLQIQATEDKIYVLDSGGTLHIFEREG